MSPESACDQILLGCPRCGLRAASGNAPWSVLRSMRCGKHIMRQDRPGAFPLPAISRDEAATNRWPSLSAQVPLWLRLRRAGISVTSVTSVTYPTYLAYPAFPTYLADPALPDLPGLPGLPDLPGLSSRRVLDPELLQVILVLRRVVVILL